MKPRTRVLLAILGVATAARLVAIDHSLPYKFVPDTHMIRGALGMAQSRDLAPPAGTYTSYPYLMPYLLLPPFAALYAGGRLAGAYRDATDFGARITDDPTPVYLIARALIALFGIASVWLTYRFGRRAVGRRAALVAASLVATSFLLVHLGNSARPWVPVVTLVLLAADRSLAYARRPCWRRALAMGVAAGLALACHQTGGLAALLPAAAVLTVLRRQPRRALAAAALSAAAFVVTALLVGFPYVLRGGKSAVGLAASAEIDSRVDLGGQSLAFESFGLDRFGETLTGFVCAEPGLVVLFLLGLAAGLAALRRRGSTWLATLYPAVLVVLFLCYEGTHVRYLSPAVPFLALFAGAGAVRLWGKGAFPRALVVLALAFPLVQVARLGWLMRAPDTRVAMLARVAEQVPADARIAVEAYGPPLRFSGDALELLAERGKWTSRLEEREGLGETPADRARPPYTVIPLERFYEFASVWPHQWLGAEGEEKPVERFLDDVGVRYLVTVDRDPGGPRNSALDELLERRGTRLAQVLPYEGKAPAEANLPMDPYRPLLSIWQVDRPGPALALWRLGPP